MKKIFLITILLSSGAFAANLDANTTSQNCQESQSLLLLADNAGGCCAAHKGVCGCSPEGAVCCDGTKAARDCPCDEAPKKK